MKIKTLWRHKGRSDYSAMCGEGELGVRKASCDREEGLQRITGDRIEGCGTRGENSPKDEVGGLERNSGQEVAPDHEGSRWPTQGVVLYYTDSGGDRVKSF